ncbi:conserved hypothetical protein [Uncinocarpus reesii 1704]|uniref:Small ribosomal subunit protein uS5m n=1 Tax=Uncinocarpus reesii (strain UAMH 1704) TaxID=336963 RepID=C4JRW6_UNCRE|nr:uncharacterized protein UREG_05205 [Uncinocarpus reesii 1704]EEP80363.1 conserved hypothetical protein [Uncinocarpus reesii 1704]
MSVLKPATRCLFCSFSRTAITPALSRIPRRQFHPSPIPYNDSGDDGRRLEAPEVPKALNQSDPRPEVEVRSKPKDIIQLRNEQEELERQLELPKKEFKNLTVDDIIPYTKEESSRLSEEYTAKQIAAIKAGEASLDPKDLAAQARIREGPWALEYLDDFSTIEPVVDHHKRAPLTNYDYNSRLKTQDELMGEFTDYVMNLPEDATPGDFLRFLDNMRFTVGKPEAELDPHDSVVPDIFDPDENLNHIGERRPRTKEQDAESDLDPGLKQLMMVTGYSHQEIKGLKVKSLVAHSVVNQTRLGKIRKAYVLSVAGNGKGLLGIGEGKSEEWAEARAQSQYRAIRNMQPILRYENRTIFGDVKGKVGAVELTLMHRPPGFGLRCQHNIWEMCRVAGIHDLAARVHRSRNPMNTVKAAFEALRSQKNPEDIARARGKKLVDVRKVYYAGNV